MIEKQAGHAGRAGLKQSLAGGLSHLQTSTQRGPDPLSNWSY
jgi:hypothetical protein